MSGDGCSCRCVVYVGECSLQMTTKLPNPYYPPELATKVRDLIPTLFRVSCHFPPMSHVHSSLPNLRYLSLCPLLSLCVYLRRCVC